MNIRNVFVLGGAHHPIPGSEIRLTCRCNVVTCVPGLVVCLAGLRPQILKTWTWPDTQPVVLADTSCLRQANMSHGVLTVWAGVSEVTLLGETTCLLPKTQKPELPSRGLTGRLGGP